MSESNKDTPVSPENPSKHLRKLYLLLPKMEWQKDRQKIFNLTPAKDARYSEMAKRFKKCSTVIFVAGTWGMGDAVIESRFATHVAKTTDKQVICQVPAPLVPFGGGLRANLPRLLDKVPAEFVMDQTAMVIRLLAGGDGVTKVERWATIDPDLTRETMEKKKENYSAIELVDFMAPEPGDPPRFFVEPYAPVQDKMGNFSILNYTAGYVAQSLGIPTTEEDIRDSSLLDLTKEEVQSIPQDLDLVLIPDAKEFPHPTKNRSMKSLDLLVWEIVLEKVPKDKKVGIVMGVSHPDYCKAVIEMALKFGLQVEVISGSLEEVAIQLFRAHTVVGMDSGTSHLAKDVQTTARKAGREIELKPVFNDGIMEFDQYGVPDVVSFTYSQETKPMAHELAHFVTA